MESKIPTAEDPIYFIDRYIEKLINSSCEEIPYEGTEVNKSQLRKDIFEFLLSHRKEFAKLHVVAELKKHIEHPNKPGYKRQDIIDRIKELES